MPFTAVDFWNERLRSTLRGYDEGLLREVAGKLCKPRNQWPAEELISRCVDIVTNPAVLDRRLQDLSTAGQTALALIGYSRQPRWPVGNLVEMLIALEAADGLQPLQELFAAGLLYPDYAADGARRGRLKKLEQWLSQGDGSILWVYAHPQVTTRAMRARLPLPACPAVAVEATERKAGSASGPVVYQADGLELPLRLAALWQQVLAAPLRLTQQRDFFKRDLERLRAEPLLNALPADNLRHIPDFSLLVVALAVAQGLLKNNEGTLEANSFPDLWQEGLPSTMSGLWSALPHLEGWNSEHGWTPGEQTGNPYPAAHLLSILHLAGLQERTWARPEAVAQLVVERHPYWKNTDGKIAASAQEGIINFLLGLAFQLRLVEATKEGAAGWLIRLSPLGRWVLGLGELPSEAALYPQTWLVQPNLEILVYRQGLTPALIARLSRFAAWKNLGAACTMQLEPDSVYRALEGGDTFVTLVQTLERHGMKPVPVPVLEALKTWSNKRERISIYPAAALFEFADAAGLQEALARGLPAVRLTDRLAVVADEAAIDYRHFRLIATRDYGLPLEKCVALESDGVTLTIDQARSDLLLETELQRFAEPLPRPTAGQPQYRITPASLATARQVCLTLEELERWFGQRIGQSLSPAVRMLLTADSAMHLSFQRELVLYVPTSDIADGLEQWPATKALIQARLGPLALCVREEDARTLRQRMSELGMDVK